MNDFFRMWNILSICKIRKKILQKIMSQKKKRKRVKNRQIVRIKMRKMMKRNSNQMNLLRLNIEKKNFKILKIKGKIF